MQKGLIRLAYQQIIDASSKSGFERSVASTSYNEFIMKAQAYNPEQKWKTFKELVAHDPKANSLHYKSGFAIGNIIQQLNNKIPVLQDALGRGINFSEHLFEILDSDITTPAAHKVAITYLTGVLTYFGNIGEQMLLAEGDRLDRTEAGPVQTFMLKMQSGLSIFSYQQGRDG
jgi:hypothetical protein